MIDLLYVAFNRLEFTRATFEELVHNTNWEEVRKLYVHDDGSSDGTAVYLRACLSEIGFVDTEFHCERLGGPVAAMLWFLSQERPSEIGMFAKIDNDLVVPPGWLDDMLRTMTLNPGLDILGIEPFVGDVTPCPSPRTITEAVHIGGKGLMRFRAFAHCRMVADGYQGFTQWQEKHPDITKAWLTPDIPCFGLDQLPESVGQWRQLAMEYTASGWQRMWPCYSEESHDYWDWWMNA